MDWRVLMHVVVLLVQRVVELSMAFVHCHLWVNIEELVGDVLEFMPIVVVIVVNHDSLLLLMLVVLHAIIVLIMDFMELWLVMVAVIVMAVVVMVLDRVSVVVLFLVLGLVLLSMSWVPM